MKKAFIILLVAFCFQNSFSQDESGVIKVRKELNNEPILITSEIIASFPGGDSAMQAYLAKTIIYPEDLKNRNIKGRVYCQFIVEKDGSISNEKIIRSSHKEFNNPILDAIRSMPKWSPGIQSGKSARVEFVIPVIFENK